jgi:hypothetical protein
VIGCCSVRIQFLCTPAVPFYKKVDELVEALVVARELGLDAVFISLPSCPPGLCQLENREAMANANRILPPDIGNRRGFTLRPVAPYKQLRTMVISDKEICISADSREQ